MVPNPQDPGDSGQDYKDILQLPMSIINRLLGDDLTELGEITKSSDNKWWVQGPNTKKRDWCKPSENLIPGWKVKHLCMSDTAKAYNIPNTPGIDSTLCNDKSPYYDKKRKIFKSPQIKKSPGGPREAPNSNSRCVLRRYTGGDPVATKDYENSNNFKFMENAHKTRWNGSKQFYEYHCAPNLTPEVVTNNLEQLLKYVIQPIECHFGEGSVHLHSGYRSRALNYACNGCVSKSGPSSKFGPPCSCGSDSKVDYGGPEGAICPYSEHTNGNCVDIHVIPTAGDTRPLSLAELFNWCIGSHKASFIDKDQKEYVNYFPNLPGGFDHIILERVALGKSGWVHVEFDAAKGPGKQRNLTTLYETEKDGYTLRNYYKNHDPYKKDNSVDIQYTNNPESIEESPVHLKPTRSSYSNHIGRAYNYCNDKKGVQHCKYSQMRVREEFNEANCPRYWHYEKTNIPEGYMMKDGVFQEQEWPQIEPLPLISPIIGCMDPAAANYDPKANHDPDHNLCHYINYLPPELVSPQNRPFPHWRHDEHGDLLKKYREKKSFGRYGDALSQKECDKIDQLKWDPVEGTYIDWDYETDSPAYSDEIGDHDAP